MSIRQDFAPLTRMLNKFIRQFDEEYYCVFSSDFEALNDEGIAYTIVVSDYNAVTFRNDFVKRFPACIDFNIFTLSFMHELGHLETALDSVKDIDQRQAIAKIKNPEKAMRKYFKLHNEKLATDWAGEYLTSHHDEMKTWEEKFMATLKKILDKYPDE